MKECGSGIQTGTHRFTGEIREEREREACRHSPVAVLLSLHNYFPFGLRSEREKRNFLNTTQLVKEREKSQTRVSAHMRVCVCKL